MFHQIPNVHGMYLGLDVFYQLPNVIYLTPNVFYLVYICVSPDSECMNLDLDVFYHTGQCKRTGGCYNELVVAFFSTGGGVKGKKNLYLLT